MTMRRFFLSVLLVSLGITSCPSVTHTSAASPALSPVLKSVEEEIEGPALPAPSIIEGNGGNGDSTSAERIADTVTLPKDTSTDWWTTVQEDIRQSEYHVTWQDQTYLSDWPAAYQSPNRTHNLRTYFTPEGPVVIPRVWSEGAETPPWRWHLRLVAWGRGGALPPAVSAILHPDANRIEYRRGDLTEWYVNDEQGLEQGFTLAAAPKSQTPNPESQVILELAFTGDLTPNLTDDRQAIEFTTPDGEPILRYADLHVTDATGHELPAHFAIRNSQLAILVDDANATYPITVDPTITGLSTTADWTGEGYSVGTAGDVNGDGYSDVIVGAHRYDGGQAEEGRAYVYHGAATGLSTNAGWTAEGNQDYANFGYSVGTAGDINGDGYADVIAGARGYDNDYESAGKVYVYHGSATGLSASANWTAEGDRDSASLGRSVGTAGDVNGDGYTDIVVGSGGHAYVYHGSATGLITPMYWTTSPGVASDAFGYSVGTAGDVNGDGYADVIVGAPHYDGGQEDEGRAYVYHGSATGLSTTAAWIAESNSYEARLGWSVGTAGDVNADGYADVIVGAPNYSTGQLRGGGAAYVYHGSATGLSASANWTAQSDMGAANFGWSVGTAGDVNGDGYADAIVGARSYHSAGRASSGRAFVYNGSATGLSITADWIAEGESSGDYLGWTVDTAGDVNGDGYSDVIVGAFLRRAYVYHGAATGLSANADWTAESDQAEALFATSVSTAGDVNGDGYADVIVGAPDYDGGQTDEGRAYVYHGGATGLSTVAGWTAEGNQASTNFGISVGTAGDVNGDGYADVIVGAHLYDITGDATLTDAGQAYVYHGSVTGLSASANWTTGSDQTEAHFGYSVNTAGDVNGDGYADVIVGAPYYDNEQTDEGQVYVYHGGVTGLSTTAAWMAESNQVDALLGNSVGTAGDVDGDGYSDVIVGACGEGRAYVYRGSMTGLSPMGGWMAEGDQASANFGISVGTAGDVNGDGYADVIVGAPGYGVGQGCAYVYHGSVTGLSTTAGWAVEGDLANVHFGYSVSTAGDVNGDGCADVIAGAPYYTNEQTDEGRAYVYLSGATGLSTTAAWMAESNQADALLGISVSTAGDVNGDGYADVIVGAPYYDNGQTDEGEAHVYYGNGGSDLNLTPRQMRTDGSVHVAPMGMSDSATGVQLHLTGRMPLGREKVKLQWQVAPLGTPFNATSVINGTSATWTDVLIGVIIVQNVTGLTQGTPYHWRVRMLYRAGNRLGQSGSRWMHIPWNGWTETDFRTADGLITGLTASNDSPTILGGATTLTATAHGVYITYTWDFGDDCCASGPVVSHTYPFGVNTAIVTASNSVNVTTATTTVTIARAVYLPLVLKRWPPIPYTPMLNAISNPDDKGNYTVSWSVADLADTYTLEEDDNASFSSPATRYTGSSTSWSASNKAVGTYYYRVKASNSWGDSNWSNIQSLTIFPVTEDACILQGHPSANAGSTIDMWVGYDDYLDPDGKIVRSLVKFNMSAIPLNATINSAVLQVYLVNSWDYPGQSRTIATYRIGSGWTESGVTWNTSPVIAETYGSASVTHGEQKWYSFDVTDLVRGWVNGSLPNLGIMLRGPEHSGPDSSWKAFSTREGSHIPRLFVTHSGYITLSNTWPQSGSLYSEQPVHTINEILTGKPNGDLPDTNVCEKYHHTPAARRCLVLP